MSGLLQEALPAGTLVVAIDPGKVVNRVWLASGERGLIGEPVSLPTLRAGVDELVQLIAASGVDDAPVIAVEATGSLHRAWTVELERRFPGRVRLLAPSETQAARTQLGSRRFKSDDRDCAASGLACAAGAGPPAGRACARGVARRGPSSPSARGGVEGAAPAAPRPAQPPLPRAVGAAGTRPHARAAAVPRDGQCLPAPSRSRAAPRASARCWRGPGTPQPQQRRVLGGALAGLSAATGRRRPSRAASRLRPRAARHAAAGAREHRQPTGAAARADRGSGADQPARRRRRARCRLRRPLAPDRALPDRGTPLLGHRSRARELRVGDDLAVEAASHARACPTTATH